MTNKIINGIDVSECTYSKIGIDEKCYCEQDLYDDGTPVFTCDECANCYFKQLKRLEQENEELQYSLKTQCVTCKRALENCRILFIADKYKQALEEIREIAKHWLNNDWSCYHCRSNMDEKLKEIIKLTRF